MSDARFSDDGRWLVTAGPQTAGLWHVPSHRFIFRLRGHRKGTKVATASFVPGSHRIVTAGMDGTVRTWFCDICGGLDELVGLAENRRARMGQALTPEERRRFSVD